MKEKTPIAMPDIEAEKLKDAQSRVNETTDPQSSEKESSLFKNFINSILKPLFFPKK